MGVSETAAAKLCCFALQLQEMRRCPLALLLLLVLLLLGEGGQAYELAELVEGSLEAETAHYYTVDATGVLVGM